MATNRFDVSQVELTKINELQKYLSTRRDDEPELFSPFHFDDVQKMSRCVRFDQKLTSTPVGDGSGYEFKVPKAPQFEMGVDIVQMLPGVVLKDEFRNDHRISWTPKTLLVIIKSAQLIAGEDPLGEPLTSESLDQILEFYAENVTRCSYEVLLSNLQGETAWSQSALEPKGLIMNQFFFHTGMILRCLKKVLSNVEFSYRYSFRLGIEELLRIEQLIDGKWVKTELETNKGEAKCGFTEISPDGKLKTVPELWATFGTSNLYELAMWKETETSSKYIDQFQELIQIPSSTIKGGKGTIRIEIKQPGAVRGILWSIRDLNQAKKNNYFVYSNSGKDNVISTTLTYGTNFGWRDVPSFHHSKRLPQQVRLRVPQSPGYHYQPNCFVGMLDEQPDTHVDYHQLGAVFTIYYHLDPESEGEPLIFLDMHRVVSYSERKISIWIDSSPINSLNI